MDKQINHYRFGNNPAMEQKRNRIKLVNIILFTVIFFTLLSGMFYGLSSPLFNLQEVVYQGNMALSTEDLQRAFPYPQGTNIWKLDLQRIEEKYASLPRITGVKAERQLPRFLLITLEEKQTVALIPYQGSYYEVAGDGELLEMSLNLPGGGFPLLTEITGLLYRPGENIRSVNGGDLIIAFLGDMGEMASSISEISVANSGNLVIITVSGQKIWLGRGDFTGKLTLLPDILAALPGKTGYLDFRVLEAPTFVAH